MKHLGATHYWLPAIKQPWITPYCFQRAYYRQIDGVWFSLNVRNEWVRSSNDQKWFDEGIALKEFMEIPDEV